MSERPERRTTAVLGAALALGCFVVFNANGREIGSYDSQPTKLLAIEIATRHSFSLGHVVGRTTAFGERPGFVRDARGNYRSAYPLPSSLAAAFVAWLLSAARVVDLRAPLSPAFVAKVTASALAALMVAFAFAAAARRTSIAAAAFIALAFGLGTNIWASVSQTLWQQETALCALMLAIVVLAPERGSRGRAVAAGALLGLAGWARPQLAPTVAVLALSMPVRWGGRATAGWLPISAIGALAIGINLRWFGHPLGAVPVLESLHPALHGVPGSVTSAPWLAAAGLLVSPSRGLLVFSPVVAFAAAGARALVREGRRSELVWCAGAAVAQFCLYSLYSVWWGGHTFGPRYALDVLPCLVPLAAAGTPVLSGRPILRVATILTLIWSVGVTALGAFVYPADVWNGDPVDVDVDHARLWDWRDSQIMRAARAPWSPQNFAFVETGALR
jgi:hypothetical protein